jgi:hypothetical protein
VTSAGRVVDGDVQSSQRIHRGGDQPLDCVRLGDVRRRDHGATALALDLGRHASEGCLVASGDNHSGAGARHRFGDLGPDAAARPGHDRSPSFEYPGLRHVSRVRAGQPPA